MKGLFLDDERVVSDVTWLIYPSSIKDWTIVKTYDDFIKEIYTGSYDVVSFDHDIQCFKGSVEFTGYDCVKALVDAIIESRINLPLIYVHSKNPVGKKNIVGYWANFLDHYNRGLVY